MAKFQVKAHELVVSRDPKNAFADSFVFEPENIEEQALGNLYVIGEVTNFSENSSYLVNLLISIIKREYYANPRRSPLDSLEAALHRANSTLADFAEQGNIEWINNLNVTIAVLKDEALHFSQTGHCRVVLIRQGDIANISQGLIAEPTASHLKTFANIASGHLEIGDQLLLATESFFNIISESETKRLSSLEFDEEIVKLEEAIRQNQGSIDSTSIILLKINVFKEAAVKLNRIEIAKDNRTPLPFQEENAQALTLAEIVAERQDGEGEAAKTSGNEFYDNPPRESGSKNNWRVAVEILKYAVGEFVKYLKIIVIKILVFIKIAALKIYAFTKNTAVPKIGKAFRNAGTALAAAFRQAAGASRQSRVKKEPVETVLLEQTENAAVTSEAAAVGEPQQSGLEFSKSGPEMAAVAGKTSGRTAKKSLPLDWNFLAGQLNVKNIIILAALVLAIFTISIVVATKKQKTAENNISHFSEVLTQATQKREAAEIALIYQDENKAKSLLKDAETDARSVFSSGYLKTESLKELNMIDDLVNKLEKVSVVSNPAIVADMAAIDKTVSVEHLALLDNIIYSFGSERNILYAYDLTKNASKQISADSANIGHFKGGEVTADKKIILYHDSPGLAIYDSKRNELKPLDISFPKNDTVAAMTFFNSSLYVLDTSSEQVVKYKRTTSGFTGGQDWIKDKGGKNLSRATSVAVDGSAYILDRDGNIYKYYTGNPVKDFSVSPLFTPLLNPEKIVTRPNLKNLYVLDPDNQRAVIFDKSGKLVKQIKSGSFNSLKDILVLDNEKTAYLLNGSVIYKIFL